MKITPIFSTIDVPELYQFKINNKRYYSDGTNTGASATTILKSQLPTSPFLINWMKQHGNDADRLATEAANYGTYYHAVCAELAKEGKINKTEMAWILEKLCHNNGWTYNSDWVNTANKQINCFAKFIIEKSVKFIGLEVPLFTEISGHYVGGTIDIIAELVFNRKIVTAVIDIKSRTTGNFYNSEIYQLELYKIMAEDAGFKIDMMFNFSPKNFQNKPTYSLENQTGKMREGSLIDKIKDYYYDKSNKIPEKIMNIPTGIDLSNYQEPENIDLSEYLKLNEF